MKIDVEGFEPEVLRGAGRLLAQRSTVWIAQASQGRPEARDAVIETFERAGHSVFWLYTPFVTAQGRPPAHPLWWGDHSIVALPPAVPNRWDLPAATAGQGAPPLDDYPHLRRYGG